ncbi:MAG: hypothetical protein EOO77_13260 [Oxalobacteraceae bacterium]|nr:MAG: hypothetical protein EOO77_13260 [Oxalobacteraceae bacterium]
MLKVFVGRRITRRGNNETTRPKEWQVVGSSNGKYIKKIPRRKITQDSSWLLYFLFQAAALLKNADMLSHQIITRQQDPT